MADPDGPRMLCEDERQRFIDCVFINNRCVRAGRKTFTECLREEPTMACKALYTAYLQCRAQLVGGWEGLDWAGFI